MMPLPTKPITVIPALRRSLLGDSANSWQPIWQPVEAQMFSERAARQGWRACSEPGVMRQSGWGVLDEPIPLEPDCRTGGERKTHANPF